MININKKAKAQSAFKTQQHINKKAPACESG